MVNLAKTTKGRARCGGIAPHAHPYTEYLAFTLAEEAYAVPLITIREVLSVPRITDVPGSPSYVLGVSSVRGQLLTVIDPRRRLRLRAQDLSGQARVLLTKTRGEETVGLVVDSVQQVLRLRTDQIEVASTTFGSDISPYVLGIGRPSAHEIVVLLDLLAVLG